jgi:site-specific recombinase XerD
MNPQIPLVSGGPLVDLADGFRKELTSQGYRPVSVRRRLQVMGHLSRWLESRHLPLRQLTLPNLEQFLKDRRQAGYGAPYSTRGLMPLMRYLYRLQLVLEPAPAATPQSDLDRLLVRYGDHLRSRRGLVESTIQAYKVLARCFLLRHFDPAKLELSRLTAAEVTQFVLDESRKYSTKTSKRIVSDLRSFLRFLLLDGQISHPLAGAVPTVACWRYGSLPRALESQSVRRLLQSCDRRTAAGLRDHAILTLLARLGLRRGEIVSLELDGIDWRQGVIKILGKGARLQRLPLPPDVGKTLTAYLCRGRPASTNRRVFLSLRPPRGSMNPTGVGQVVHRACRRARIPSVGPHRLRHTIATEMLREGASLPEVAQVLRHQSILTTAIYAKVDRTALRTVAQPWPGGKP